MLIPQPEPPNHPQFIKDLLSIGPQHYRRSRHDHPQPHFAPAALVGLVAAPVHAQPQEKYERKGKGEWSYSYDDGRLIEKEERKGREYSYERKRVDAETKFKREKDGSWKEEITCHGCKITREYKAD